MQYCKNFIILTSTVFLLYHRLTDELTGGRTGDSTTRGTRYSIYAVARKNGVVFGGTTALFSCFRMYSLLLALDTTVLMLVVQDKLESK